MASSPRPTGDHRRLLRFPLPGGVDAVRLPSTIADEVLDEALRSDAAWLLLDATGAEDRVEAVGLQVAQALGRSSRTPARTCLVCRRRPSVIPAEVATFATIEDACQARLFDEAGFGSGWAPAPPGFPAPGRPAVSGRVPSTTSARRSTPSATCG
jgi:hypothetical protein